MWTDKGALFCVESESGSERKWSILANSSPFLRTYSEAGWVEFYLSVCVSVILICSGVVILLDKAKILLPLPLENQIPSFSIGRKIALRESTRKEENANLIAFRK